MYNKIQVCLDLKQVNHIVIKELLGIRLATNFALLSQAVSKQNLYQSWTNNQILSLLIEGDYIPSDIVPFMNSRIHKSNQLFSPVPIKKFTSFVALKSLFYLPFLCSPLSIALSTFRAWNYLRKPVKNGFILLYQVSGGVSLYKMWKEGGKKAM